MADRDQVSDTADDALKPHSPLDILEPLGLPGLIFGAGSFAKQYNDDSYLESDIPQRTVKLALRYGICAFDTSPYYGNSEIILGNALKSLESEFPRSSYRIITKCGRNGPKKEDFDYSPSSIRKSVERSLDRLHTAYLDAVYLHDVEFVCEQMAPQDSGDPSVALASEMVAYGLAEGLESKVLGKGDQVILDALAELRKMQSEGLIKYVGISGYPLPTLLRLALLALHTPPFKPLDILLSYCHATLQNNTFHHFMPHFKERAAVSQLVLASPLSMGLLTSKVPPWHPAPMALRNACDEAIKSSESWGGGLPNLAVGFGLMSARALGLPLAVGFSTPKEVHECVEVWTAVKSGADVDKRKKREEDIRQLLKRSTYQDWSWPSP